MNARARQLARYGLTIAGYDALLKKQGGKCAICRTRPKTRRLSVDHDHRYEKGNPVANRCLACHQCNRFRIGKNTLTTARRVVRVLEAHERRSQR